MLIDLTHDEMTAAALALDNCNGDSEDMTAVFGPRKRLHEASLSASVKLYAARKSRYDLLRAVRELIELHDRCGDAGSAAGDEWQTIDSSPQMRLIRRLVFGRCGHGKSRPRVRN